MPDLSGKAAIVTGCASGIGAATVQRLRADGAEVLGTDVNIRGVMAGCRAAIAAMKANPGGSTGAIVNIASTSAMAALPSDVAYCSSKGAVRVLSKSIATHCAKQGYNIRCNTVIPGATETGILNTAEEHMPGLKAAVAATSPLNRLGDPAETAAAIAFLASDECPFMTGAEMLVDGGALSIHPGF